MSHTAITQTWPTVLFDVDGTLVASGELIMECFQAALVEIGRDPLTDDQITHVVGPPLGYSFSHFAQIEPELMDEAIRVYRALYLPRFLEPPMYPGIPELVAELAEAGVRLGTATSKMETMAQAQLEYLGLAPYFDVIAGASPDPASTKSHVVADALSRLGAVGADLDRPVLVGDRHHDVEGATDNNIAVIGAGWGYGSPEEFTAPAVVAVAAQVADLRDLLL
ncbi:HAD hydrolase-like protein [Scrofimicrobium sp. R131]|uniref:HAD hydrolase-like protein n=1 Tax=Scrofimicrobium appendicitidis TaxID=3079930 RepID=A0AAU7V7W5_9ACTO